MDGNGGQGGSEDDEKTEKGMRRSRQERDADGRTDGRERDVLLLRRNSCKAHKIVHYGPSTFLLTKFAS